MLKRTSIAIATAGLAACASQPPQQPVADNSPANPTAVVETLIINSGILGMLPFEANEKQYVRGNMRREEHSVKGTGTFTGFFVTALTGEGDTNIVRLDRDVLWTVNNGKKEYTECPAHGCPTPPAKGEKREERKPEPKQETEKGCSMRVASSNFDVKQTGQKRSINGFNTDQYTVAWVVKLQDNAKRSTTSTLSFDLWTSPMTQPMRDAFAVESAFNKAYVASAPRAARPASKSEADRAQVMPSQVAQMMLGYLGSLSPADRQAFLNAGKQLAKIQGHPISTKIEWRLDGNACAPKEGSSSPRQAQPGAGGMLSGITSLFGSKKEEKAGDTPIFSFTIEVKSLKVEPVRDSVFTVPASYKLVK